MLNNIVDSYHQCDGQHNLVLPVVIHIPTRFQQADDFSSCRRKLAVAESRKRMSLVVLNELINNFIKTELVSVAKDAKRCVIYLSGLSLSKMIG